MGALHCLQGGIAVWMQCIMQTLSDKLDLVVESSGSLFTEHFLVPLPVDVARRHEWTDSSRHFALGLKVVKHTAALTPPSCASFAGGSDSLACTKHTMWFHDMTTKEWD